MPRFIKKSSKKAGLPPGTLVHVGERKQDVTRISVMDYEGDRLDEHCPMGVETVFPLQDEPATSWINIDGDHDIGIGNWF